MWSEKPWQTPEQVARDEKMRRLPPVFNTFDATRNESAEQQLREEIRDNRFNKK